MADKPVCKIDGCDKQVVARGWCSKHYERWRKHGDPTHLARTPQGEPLKWLEAHSRHTGDECLTFPFSRCDQGYGQTVFRGKKRKASRVMCFLAHGDPPTEKHVAAHKCGNGHLGCVNPTHIRWATASENIEDMLAHGNSTRGRLNPMASLDDEQVRKIRQLCSTRSLTQPEIGAMFGVSQSTVSAIHRRENWQWLD